MSGRTVRSVVAAILLAALWIPSLVAAVDAPVADAAMRGDAKTVRHLLQRGTDVNAAQGDGMSALHWAALNDDLTMVEMLVYAGANVKASTRIGAHTPLFMASRAGNAAIVGALLDAGADPNATITTGATPLMPAAASGSTGAVTALLDHGAEVNATESATGQTALMFAAAFDRPDAIAALVRGGADVGLVTNVVDVAAREEAARNAGRRRQTRVRREREERQAEEKARAEAVRAAAGEAAPAEAEEEGDARQRQGEGEPQSGAGNDRRGEDGKRNPFVRFFRWFIPGGGDQRPAADDGPKRLTYGQLVGHQGGLTALHFAAREGHRASVRALLDARADVNAVSGDQSSPLLVATINGRFDLAMYLLQRGADPNLASDGGGTPLYGAINMWWAPHAFYPQPSAAQEQTTHLELMQALLDAGANPNARITKKLWYTGYNFDQSGVDEKGSTPFWRAAQAADLPAMRLLIAAGADFAIPTQVVPSRPVRNDNGFKYPEPPRPIDGPAVTPLQAASGAGYDGNYHRQAPGGFLPAVKFLVEQTSVDVSLADDKGNTPLHNAALRGDNEMIRYLVSKGADLHAMDRRGRNVSDWANGPIQRLQPFTETLALLAQLGAPPHNDRCVSC